MKIILVLLSLVSLACTWASPVLAHEHTIATPEIDRKFLDSVQRPDVSLNFEARSKLCCTDEDSVKVDAEWEISQDAKYPERIWFVWINIKGPDGRIELKRVRVPPQKVVSEHSPSGQAYVFLWSDNSIQCFVPPLDRY